MTALAMIIGMLPMAFALGEGGEQNAPLGRAVIGGLLFATPYHAVLRADYLHAASKESAGGYGSPDRKKPGRFPNHERASMGHGVSGWLLAAGRIRGGCRFTSLGICRESGRRNSSMPPLEFAGSHRHW
jgi:hypothetical protein